MVQSDGGCRRFRRVLSNRLATCGLIVVLVAATATAMKSDAGPGTGLGVRGADISFTLQGEAIGQTHSVSGQVMPLEVLLAAHGATHVRVRVWVNPAEGISDLQSALILARRAAAAGMKIVVDLHYSDTWADRVSQTPPQAWAGLTPDQLGSQVETYTRDVMTAFAAQGTPADIVQIGNEINNGFLWPAGAIYGPDGQRWQEFSDLLRAGIRGATPEGPDPTPSIMIHVDTGGDVEASIYFFDRLRDFGVEFDIIGLSYYPFWNGSLSKLSANLTALADRYGKDILVAETAYPWTLESADGPTVVSDISSLPDAGLYPPTPAGQGDYYLALAEVLRNVPGGKGAGFLVWEPGWLPGVSATPELGNTHNNLTLFDWSGNALPAAFTAFHPGNGD